MDNRETLTPSSGDAILKRHLFSEVARNLIKGRGHIERAYFVRRPSRQSFGFRVAASSGPIPKAPGSAGGYLQATSIGLLLIALVAATPAAAQKRGGTLRLYHNDNPPSTSLLEESTIASVTPFAAVFNNLVVFDPSKPHESLETVIPDLAESWSWDSTNTRLTFKLRRCVTWHDGQPFTAKDVQCTWWMLIGKGDVADFHRNPRRVWYSKLQDVSVNGDYEATFELSEPQPSLPVLLASAFSAVYPCHVPQATMRTRPVGTGPFKFVQFKRGGSIRLWLNPDYWTK